ncbi:MAG: tRNA (adenosine(37)-N6)-threonylcarbamoyltransferase complex dimerization subunit type 1 TsaB [Acidimicrobiia bacterium]|nr:tRNA (adenosine(37)-N6)-threonylcarbamoyltransferase complex dimerization subunit type 1 TsaB [Acidimicrobiia bacterium]
MHVLAIDTATAQVGVAIGVGDHVAGEVRLVGGRRHAEHLVPVVERLCDDTGVRLDRLAAIGVGVGPGLFTGLRVGVATAKMLARVLRVPMVAVGSLDLVAHPLRHADRQIAAVLDARRSEVFYGRYRTVPGGVLRIGDPTVVPPEDVVGDLLSRGVETLLAGDGVSAHPEVFTDVDRAEWAGPTFDFPSPASLVALTAHRVEREDFAQPAEVVPVYLRAADARINWEQRSS